MDAVISQLHPQSNFLQEEDEEEDEEEEEEEEDNAAPDVEVEVDISWHLHPGGMDMDDEVEDASTRLI